MDKTILKTLITDQMLVGRQFDLTMRSTSETPSGRYEVQSTGTGQGKNGSNKVATLRHVETGNTVKISTAHNSEVVNIRSMSGDMYGDATESVFEAAVPRNKVFAGELKSLFEPLVGRVEGVVQMTGKPGHSDLNGSWTVVNASKKPGRYGPIVAVLRDGERELVFSTYHHSAFVDTVHIQSTGRLHVEYSSSAPTVEPVESVMAPEEEVSST